MDYLLFLVECEGHLAELLNQLLPLALQAVNRKLDCATLRSFAGFARRVGRGAVGCPSLDRPAKTPRSPMQGARRGEPSQLYNPVLPDGYFITSQAPLRAIITVGRVVASPLGFMVILPEMPL